MLKHILPLNSILSEFSELDLLCIENDDGRQMYRLASLERLPYWLLKRQQAMNHVIKHEDKLITLIIIFSKYTLSSLPILGLTAHNYLPEITHNQHE